MQRRFLRKRCAAGKALLGASGLNPLRHGLRRATSPERGRFCSTYRKEPKSSPFGGAGRDRRERTERVCSRGYPLSLCFANPPPPKGGGFALLTGRSRKAPPSGELDATDGSGLRGFAPGDTPSVFASQIHLPRKGEVLLYLPEGAEKLPLRGSWHRAQRDD